MSAKTEEDLDRVFTDKSLTYSRRHGWQWVSKIDGSRIPVAPGDPDIMVVMSHFNWRNDETS